MDDKLDPSNAVMLAPRKLVVVRALPTAYATLSCSPPETARGVTFKVPVRLPPRRRSVITTKPMPTVITLRVPADVPGRTTIAATT